MTVLKAIGEAVIDGNVLGIGRLVQEALDEKIAPTDIIQNGLALGMQEVGRRFKNDEMYMPEVLVSAKAMSTAIELLEPLLADAEIKSKGKVIIGTVKGDVHDIGKNIVIMMLRGAGYDVLDLGVDVAPEAFIEATRKEKPHIVGMCALLSTTMPFLGKTIKAFADAGVRDIVKMIVGGAPVNQKYADEIGADGYAENAGEAVELVDNLMRN